MVPETDGAQAVSGRRETNNPTFLRISIQISARLVRLAQRKPQKQATFGFGSSHAERLQAASNQYTLP